MYRGIIPLLKQTSALVVNILTILSSDRSVGFRLIIYIKIKRTFIHISYRFNNTGLTCWEMFQLFDNYMLFLWMYECFELFIFCVLYLVDYFSGFEVHQSIINLINDYNSFYLGKNFYCVLCDDLGLYSHYSGLAMDKMNSEDRKFCLVIKHKTIDYKLSIYCIKIQWNILTKQNIL
jgi:hypothetical protein